MSKKIKTTNYIENTLVGSISNQLKHESYNDRRVRNDIRLSQLTQFELDIINRYKSEIQKTQQLYILTYITEI